MSCGQWPYRLQSPLSGTCTETSASFPCMSKNLVLAAMSCPQDDHDQTGLDVANSRGHVWLLSGWYQVRVKSVAFCIGIQWNPAQMSDRCCNICMPGSTLALAVPTDMKTGIQPQSSNVMTMQSSWKPMTSIRQSDVHTASGICRTCCTAVRMTIPDLAEDIGSSPMLKQCWFGNPS